MKGAAPGLHVASPFLAKEAPLVAFARQHRGRTSQALAQQGDSTGKFILAPGERIAEHYEVGPIIGAGSTGIVYKARHVELGQLVAIKVIRPDMARNGSVWRRFSREARALAALHNKHVVRVHDAGTLPSGLRYLVMELLHGCSLRALLEKNGAVPPRYAADYAIQVCSALADAHRGKIIHRGMRPENIFLAKYRAAEPTVKLLDFGMALFLDDAAQRTLTGRAAAHAEYLSPEQLRDSRSVDPRSDLWGVGLLLFEMLAGRSPLSGLNAAQICLQLAQGAVPKLEDVCPSLPPGLARVTQHCLQIDPAQRPQSAEELSLALEPFSSRHAAPGA